ncbi:MAG: DUF4292 domain-containing protein [Bacteroidaceae bacterium]|nr:DUF4292 domain-containing protein [Bacteroidaceae bacterium]
MKQLTTIIPLALMLMLAACGGSKTAVGGGASNMTVETVIARATAVEPVRDMSARCNFTLDFGGKNLSAGGTVKMQRGSIIQLSATLLGFEVGRIEFTPSGVLIIDRVGKRYLQGSYEEVEFARRNNLGFDILQSLFWGELFAVGGKVTPDRFTLTQTGDMAVLMTRSDELVASFVTAVATGAIVKTNVTGVKDMSKALNVTYNARQEGIPSDFILTAEGVGSKTGIGLQLSNIRQNTGNQIQSTVIDTSRYRRIDAKTVITSLFSF